MAKFTGKGAQFLIKTTGATPAYVEVGQISEIGDIAVTADEIDATTLDAGDYRQFLQGFKDPGDCALTVVYDPGMVDQGDDPDGLYGIFTSGEIREIAIRLNSSAVGGHSYLTFQAFIRDWTFNALNPDDLQTVTPLFRLSGPITLVDVLPTGLTAPQSDMPLAA